MAAPPLPPRLAVNSEILDQIGLLHEAMVARERRQDERFTAFHAELSRLNTRLDEGARASLPPVPRTSAQKLAGGALAGGRYGLLILGALGLLSAGAKLWRPELAGPLDSLIEILGAP